MNKLNKIYTSHNYEDTLRIGQEIACNLKGNEVVALFGGLGMGKTALTTGIAKGLGSNDSVSSPTFALVNEYHGKCNLYHFDMYRILSWDDLYSIGFFDYFDTGVLVIEWSENIENALPQEYIKITLEKGSSESERIITVEECR